MCIQDYHYWWSVMYLLGATIQMCPVRLYFLRSLHHSNHLELSTVTLQEIILLVQCSAAWANQLRLGVNLWDLTNEVTWRQVRIHTSKNKGSNRYKCEEREKRRDPWAAEIPILVFEHHWGRLADLPSLAFSFSCSSYSCIADTQLLWISSPKRFRSATDLSTSSASRAMHSSLRKDKHQDTPQGPVPMWPTAWFCISLLLQRHFLFIPQLPVSRLQQGRSSSDYD